MHSDTQKLIDTLKGVDLNKWSKECGENLAQIIIQFFNTEFKAQKFNDSEKDPSNLIKERFQMVHVLNQLLTAYLDYIDDKTIDGKRDREKVNLFDDKEQSIDDSGRKSYYNELINCVILANRCAHIEEKNNFINLKSFYYIKDFIAKNYLLRQRKDMKRLGIELYSYLDQNAVNLSKTLVIEQSGFGVASIHLSNNLNEWTTRAYNSLSVYDRPVVETTSRKYIDRDGNPYLSSVERTNKGFEIEFLETCVDSNSQMKEYEKINLLSKLGIKIEDIEFLQNNFNDGNFIYSNLNIDEFFNKLKAIPNEPEKFKDYYESQIDSSKIVLNKFISNFIIENSDNIEKKEQVEKWIGILKENITDRDELKSLFENSKISLDKKIKIIYDTDLTSISTKTGLEQNEILNIIAKENILNPENDVNKEINRLVLNMDPKIATLYREIYLEKIIKLDSEKKIKNYSIDEVFEKLEIPVVQESEVGTKKNQFSSFWMQNRRASQTDDTIQKNINLKLSRFLGYSLGKKKIGLKDDSYDIKDLKWIQSFFDVATKEEKNEFKTNYINSYIENVMKTNKIGKEIIDKSLIRHVKYILGDVEPEEKDIFKKCKEKILEQIEIFKWSYGKDLEKYEIDKYEFNDMIGNSIVKEKNLKKIKGIFSKLRKKGSNAKAGDYKIDITQVVNVAVSPDGMKNLPAIEKATFNMRESQRENNKTD